MINEANPEIDDVLHCETAAEAFATLKNKYGNSNGVCTRVIKEWLAWAPYTSLADQAKLIQVDTQFTALNNDLKAVNQEKQLTH